MAATAQARRGRRSLLLLFAASARMIAGAMTAGLGDVPLNAHLLTRNSASRPANPTARIEKWRLDHLART